MQDLQPQVKLKLLLAFFHISRRNLETWRPQLDQIIDVRPFLFFLPVLLSSCTVGTSVVDSDPVASASFFAGSEACRSGSVPSLFLSDVKLNLIFPPENFDILPKILKLWHLPYDADKTDKTMYTDFEVNKSLIFQIFQHCKTWKTVLSESESGSASNWKVETRPGWHKNNLNKADPQRW